MCPPVAAAPCSVGRLPDWKLWGDTVRTVRTVRSAVFGQVGRHPSLDGSSPFDVVDPECWGTLINGWKHALDHGIGGGGVRTLAGDEATIACFDVRPAHGVLVAVPVDQPGESMPDLNDELPLSARFGTFARDVVGAIVSHDDGGAALLGWAVTWCPR